MHETTEDQTLRLWMADCAAHVLPLFLRRLPSDPRPANIIEAARAFTRGHITAGEMASIKRKTYVAVDAPFSQADRWYGRAGPAAYHAAQAAVACAAPSAPLAAEKAAEEARKAAAWGAVEDAPIGARVTSWNAAWAAETAWQRARREARMNDPTLADWPLST